MLDTLQPQNSLEADPARPRALVERITDARLAQWRLLHDRKIDTVLRRLTQGNEPPPPAGYDIPLIRENLAPLSFVDVPRSDYISGTLAIYELNRVELLRDVFAWAYERSCQRYTTIRDSLPEPDPLSFRHRDALTEVVSGIVRDMAQIDGPAVRRLAEPLVDADDLDDFVSLAINELYQLHEGSLARFRLRPTEFHRWRHLQNSGTGTSF